MRVLKFSRTFINNEDYFLRIADVVKHTRQQEQIAIVLSASKKITSSLIKLIKKTINGKDILLDIINIEYDFIKILQNISKIQSGLNYKKQKNIIKNEFNKLKKLFDTIKLSGQCTNVVNATIICSSEKLSIIIMAALLQARGHKITIINPMQKLLAFGHSLESSVDIAESRRRIIKNQIPKNHIILMAAFIAGNEKGELMLLGRNGSDYSAAILAVCLQANCCEIWNYTGGICSSSEPNLVPHTRLLRSISYQEAMEFSYFGSKFLHPRTIALIAQFKIPCLIKNIINPRISGTLISSQKDRIKPLVKGITTLKNMVMFDVSGDALKREGIITVTSRILKIMSFTGISVILMTQSYAENRISLCVSQEQQIRAYTLLNNKLSYEIKNNLLNQIQIIKNLAIISIIGDGILNISIIYAKIVLALARANINIIAFSKEAYKSSLSIVINNNDVITGIRVLHKILFININKIIEVFVIGIGGVGSALLSQLYHQQIWLKKKYIDLRVCGIANSRALITNVYGIDLSNWQSQLSIKQEKFTINNWMYLVKKYNLINPVIVDCTSSQEIANQYVNFLKKGFHIVTSNKKSNTSSWKYYNQIRITAAKWGRKFLYDTNIGAGLPIIENLQNLFNAGDKLIKFSGILSGSLSFIFGKLDEGISFSKATIMARKLGFTEPNPRDDLSGIDVARKLLILARESGYKLELSDVIIEPILPTNIMEITNIEHFIQNLSKIDNVFAKRATNAHNQDKVLRLVGIIENNGTCKVQIHEVDSNDPLYKIKNGENALAFYSKYYQPIPLVIRGYGAGNNVTAAGIFADLLRTLSCNL
ncbi:bifunctional aspartate kinase/homoserine dehydrogenase I [Pantoea sp. Mhis]|uniref:bifunctional aspartate kinase/homoserine dehydrogenase I n=1 Tax=Pantoea sp. Mhis TaxID=2576759 RepID=UPI001357F065|nr:bifunctional aspartate kinase/homoserine dehydrogenase I [Pantoea sp. Mhis]MXP56462.1 bifunctional aspartate kinase/homoserine dehydrogenase I [Pantoea sp. Mhis]